MNSNSRGDNIHMVLSQLLLRVGMNPKDNASWEITMKELCSKLTAEKLVNAPAVRGEGGYR